MDLLIRLIAFVFVHRTYSQGAKEHPMKPPRMMDFMDGPILQSLIHVMGHHLDIRIAQLSLKILMEIFQSSHEHRDRLLERGFLLALYTAQNHITTSTVGGKDNKDKKKKEKKTTKKTDGLSGGGDGGGGGGGSGMDEGGNETGITGLEKRLIFELALVVISCDPSSAYFMRPFLGR